MEEATVIGWFEIAVQDPIRAKSFYCNLFDCDFRKLDSPDLEMWEFVNHKPSEVSGALVKSPNCKSGENSVVVYFQCDDCAIQAARARENGGTVFKDKFSIGDDWYIAIVLDPDGNAIGLQSRA